MNRSSVRLDLEVLAPIGAFDPHGQIGPPRTKARITKVVKKWRGQPSVVELEDDDGRVGRCNVCYLELVTTPRGDRP